MDPPFGHIGHHHHHSHHHNRRDDDDGDEYPPPPPFTSSPYPPPQTYPPPPPSFGGAYDSPPPPAGVFHSSHYPPPPYLESQNYPPPHHHQPFEAEEEERPHHGFRPHMPGFITGHFNQHGYDHQNPDHSSDYYDHSGGPTYGDGGVPHLGDLANKPTHKIICKAGGDSLHVAVREGKMVLTYPNPDDPTQHWYKDERYSIRVKDKDGYPSFILVNKGTGLAVKHPVSGHPVQLVPYKPDVFDESVLWTESKDLGSGFRTIRTVNNVKLVMDAWNADQKHGGIHDGTFVALFDVWKGDNQNQQWKIVPY